MNLLYKSIMAMLFFCVCLNAENVGDNYLVFSGNDGEYVSCPKFTALSGSEEFTIEGWFFFKRLSLGTGLVFIGEESNSYISIKVAGNKRNSLTITFSDGHQRAVAITEPIVKSGEWVHVAVVYNGKAQSSDLNVQNRSRLKCYKNGRKVDLKFVEDDPKLTMAIPSLVPALKGGLNIGSEDGKKSFAGKMTEVRIWNKSLASRVIYKWKDITIDKKHPNRKHLLAYYDMKTVEKDNLVDVCGGHPATFMGGMSGANLVGGKVFGDNLIDSLAADDPDYIIFNTKLPLSYKLTDKDRDPFFGISRERTYGQGELTPEEMVLVKKILDSYSLRGAVKGGENSADICLFNKGKYKVGETFIVKAGGKNVEVLVYKIKENPLGVILKVGTDSFIKQIEK